MWHKAKFLPNHYTTWGTLVQNCAPSHRGKSNEEHIQNIRGALTSQQFSVVYHLYDLYLALQYCKTFNSPYYYSNYFLYIIAKNINFVEFTFSVNGNRVTFSVQNQNKEEISKWIEYMRTRSGVNIQRIRKPWHTENPSIQGTWHPFTNKDPAINLATFPDKNLGETIAYSLSATEILKLKQTKSE